MSEFKLKEKCSINSNMDSDKFVGIKCEKGDLVFTFHLDFALQKRIKSYVGILYYFLILLRKRRK